MKTSKNRNRKNQGLDAIKSFLRRHNIPFQEIDQTTVWVPIYGAKQDPVNLVLSYDPADSMLLITVSSGMIVEDDIQKYIDDLNDRLPFGDLIVCPDCSVLHYQCAISLSVDDMTDETLSEFIEDTTQLYREIIVPFSATGTGWSPLGGGDDPQDPKDDADTTNTKE